MNTTNNSPDNLRKVAEWLVEHGVTAEMLHDTLNRPEVEAAFSAVFHPGEDDED